MPAKPIYLDYMATTPVDPRVLKKMRKYLDNNCNFGNSASQHFYGYRAKEAIENARCQVAAVINTTPQSIVWTSGATEANNLAIKGAACFYQRQGKHIITCKTEHKSVLDTCKYLEHIGFKVSYISPKQDGLIDLETLIKAVQDDTILISIMHVNNEIGVMQDIAAISAIARSRGILFHVDATQSIGKIPIDLQELKIDLMSFSAHKIYGPKGIGALYIRQNPKLHLTTQIHGGEQEQNIRSGTLPTHQIVGMGEALKIANQEMSLENSRLIALRDYLWQEIKILKNIQLNGSLDNRIANNLNISFTDININSLSTKLKKIAVSNAATCNNGQASHVLKAIGLSDKHSANTIRISIGRFTTNKEIELTAEYIKKIIAKYKN
jgi:cysteine desulfurase